MASGGIEWVDFRVRAASDQHSGAFRPPKPESGAVCTSKGGLVVALNARPGLCRLRFLNSGHREQDSILYVNSPPLADGLHGSLRAQSLTTIRTKSARPKALGSCYPEAPDELAHRVPLGRRSRRVRRSTHASTGRAPGLPWGDHGRPPEASTLCQSGPAFGPRNQSGWWQRRSSACSPEQRRWQLGGPSQPCRRPGLIGP